MGKTLLQLQESEGSDLMIEDVVDGPRDQDPVAVAKAKAIDRVAAEND